MVGVGVRVGVGVGVVIGVEARIRARATRIPAPSSRQLGACVFPATTWSGLGLRLGVRVRG